MLKNRHLFCTVLSVIFVRIGNVSKTVDFRGYLDPIGWIEMKIIMLRTYTLIVIIFFWRLCDKTLYTNVCARLDT